MFVANGNNISIADDLGRRTLLVQLDAKIEKPWHRAFQGNILEEIASDRGKFIAAALTIPPAYIAAGIPSARPMQACGESRARPARAPIQ